MDFEVMPQVDKSASTYSPPVQYVPAISSTSTLARPELSKFGVPNDILTSCDWSAVIHRPAEDSEPEDLPSTVDIDAIKEPATPLPPLTPGHHQDDDGSDSDDEESSGSESDDAGSSSDSESQSQDGSGSESSLSEDSDSSEASGKPRLSSESSPEPQREQSPTNFNEKETNRSEGAVELKVSTTKSKSSPSRSSSSSSSSSSSDCEEQARTVSEPQFAIAAKKKPIVFKENATVSRTSSSSSSGKDSKDSKQSKATALCASDRNLSSVKSREMVTNAARSSGASVVRRTPVKRPALRSASQRKSAVSPRKPLRGARKSPRTRRSGNSGGGESSSQLESSDEDDEVQGNADDITNLAHQLRVQGISDPLQEINQEDLAAILPDVTGGGSLDGFEEENAVGGGSREPALRGGGESTTHSHLSTSSTSSSSSDSDTEQIVSDVISRIQDDSEPPPPPSTSTTTTSAAKTTSRTVQLSPSSPLSDRSTRNQIGNVYSSNLLADFVEKTELLSRGGGGSVSSSSECPRRNEENSSEIEPSNASGDTFKRRRGRPSRQLKGVSSTGNRSSSGMPELEAYMRLDCSQSNVSPDSGIQSVAGSPAGGHHSPPGSPRSPVASSSHICGGPPVLSKASSPSPSRQDDLSSSNNKLAKIIATSGEMKLENGGKKGPGRPKLSVHSLATFGRRKRKRSKKTDNNRAKNSASQLKAPVERREMVSEIKVPPFIASEYSSDVDESDVRSKSTEQSSHLPKLPAAMVKRGRGRPKKSPPVLEPNFPLPGEEKTKQPRDNSPGDSGLLTLPDKSKELALKCAKIAFTKGLMKNKEHKHKKRKRHGPEFRRLNPEFLSELSRLADMIRTSCYISPPSPKKDVSRCLKIKKPSKNKRKRRSLTVEPVEEPKQSESQASKESDKIVDPVVKQSPENNELPKQSENQSSVKSNSSKKERKSSKSSRNKEKDRTKEKSLALRERNVNRNSSRRDKRTSRHSKEKSRANSDKEKPTVAVVEMENVASLVKVTDEKDDDKPVNCTSSEQTVTFVPKGEISTQTGREDVDDEKDYNVSGRSSAALQEKIEPTTPQSSSAASLTPEASLVPDNVPVKSKVATAGHRERNPTRELHSKDKIKLSRESTPAKDKTAAASSVCSDLLAPSPALSEEKDKLKDKLRSSSPASKDKPPLPSKDKPSSASSSRERSATAPSLHSREKSTSNSSQKDKDSKVSCGSPGSAPISQKRRVKKSAVEFPKKEKREETNSNEQRLPLKKRHYVTSASSTVLGINDESGEVTSELEIKAEGECGPKQPSPSSCDSKSPAVSPSETKTDPKRPDKDDALVNKDKSEVQVEAEKKPPIQTRTRDKDIAIAVVESVPRRTPSRTCSSSNSTPSSSKRLSTRHKSAADNQRSNGVVPLKRSQRLKTKNEEEVVDKPSPLTKETSKRQAKVCDEPLEQKLADLVKNGDKLKCESLADIQISTRSFSKSLTADGCPDGDFSKATTGSQPPEGIFVPSVKPALEILKLALPSQSEVLSKIKSKLLSDINVDEELNIIKRSAAESGIESAGPSRPKRRKTEADSRPIVRATPGTIVKLKMKRKKINRTGFPVKKKKKKRMDVTGVANGSTPPVLEDQTKLKIITDADPSTPALSPIVPKTEETVKENLVEPTTTQPSKPEEIPEPDSMPPQADVEAVPDTLETSAITVTNKDKTGEQSNCLRPASKRIMELKAKSEAVGQRKRKQVAEDSQEEEESKKEGSEECPEMKFLTKKAKKCKEELDDSDAESVKLGKKILPKWRKKYLPAGLFSDYFKEDEPRKPSTDKSKGDSEIVDLLPLPAYCAKWVRQRKLPFQLPHDIWWLHTHNQLPGREAVPSWNYRKLRTNFYFDVKPSFSYEAQACNCKPTEEVCCGDDCINRMVFAECSPQLCPCKDKCSNQKIQRHDWAPGLAKFMTKDKGWGVKTKQKIQKDEFILEYVGEVVSEKEFKSRMASRYQNDTHHYCLNLDGGLVIDGHRMGGDGRFVNHSCEPNCEMQKWCVNGLFRMALFALRDINPNEELTYDYNFSLFNPSEGQPCKCGSSKCRGVIGGKYQRVSLPGSSGVSSNTVEEKEKPVGQVGRPRKSSCASSSRRKSLNVDKKVATNKSSRDLKSSQNRENSKEAFGSNALATVAARLCHMTQLKPITPQQRLFIIDNKIFLLRTLQKVKERVEKLRKAVKNSGLLAVCDIPLLNANLLATAGANGSPSSVVAPTSQNSQINGTTSSIIAKEGEKEVFMSQLKALSNPRSVRTRRLALAEDNPEMTKAARLACVFKNLYSEVINFKDESGDYLSSNFTTLPSKRKLPLYYQRVQNPIDFNTIEQNIVTGVYKTVESFDLAMNTLFKNNVRWYGRITDLGIAATRLRKIYNLAKLECLPKLEEILGEPPPASFIPARDDPSGEEEDVIRCICGMYRDEGLMIQCERCLVWQHCYCVKANSSVEKYLCERCNPREVDLEIPSQEEPDENAPGQTNYLTLLRGDLQLKQGDTVYVLRDIVDEESTTVPKSKHTYKTIKNWKYIDCDIFKIERLWKDEKGDRFAFGHHYLRPHETFHEPTRKFFPNELMRVPLYEVVPIDLIMDHCYVLDLNTYCKGRPLGSNPDHIYVCEYRVDKVARMFAKIPKPKHSNVCTKAYAFETFDVRLKPQRTYAPHGPPKESFSSSSTSTLSAPKEARETSSSRGRGGKSAQNLKDSNQNHEDQTQTPATPLPARSHQLAQYPPDKRLAKKTRLDRILQRLLAKLPSKQPLDLSYLLEPGRRQRKKPPLLAS